MAIKIVVQPPEVKKIGSVTIRKLVVEGGITISKAAKKLLEKQQQRIDHSAPPKKPEPPPAIVPSVGSPEKSTLHALWALKGRPNRTLYLVRVKDGKRYRVTRYDPHTRFIYMKSLDYDVEFDVQMTGKIENTYSPLWSD